MPLRPIRHRFLHEKGLLDTQCVCLRVFWVNAFEMVSIQQILWRKPIPNNPLPLRSYLRQSHATRSDVQRTRTPK